MRVEGHILRGMVEGFRPVSIIPSNGEAGRNRWDVVKRYAVKLVDLPHNVSWRAGKRTPRDHHESRHGNPRQSNPRQYGGYSKVGR